MELKNKQEEQTQTAEGRRGLLRASRSGGRRRLLSGSGTTLVRRGWPSGWGGDPEAVTSLGPSCSPRGFAQLTSGLPQS